ncbi:MAG: hypothetical protein ABI647_06290 [Gemmatimonadota bacterium]
MALAVTLAAGCTGSPRFPTGLGDDTNTPVVSQLPSRLIGVWQTRAITTVGGVPQDVTTTWQFNQDGSCSFNQDAGLNLDGTPNVVTRDCTYSDQGPTASITFTDTGDILTLGISFPNADLSLLVLDGTQYQRIP